MASISRCIYWTESAGHSPDGLGRCKRASGGIRTPPLRKLELARRLEPPFRPPPGDRSFRVHTLDNHLHATLKATKMANALREFIDGISNDISMYLNPSTPASLPPLDVDQQSAVVLSQLRGLLVYQT